MLACARMLQDTFSCSAALSARVQGGVSYSAAFWACLQVVVWSRVEDLLFLAAVASGALHTSMCNPAHGATALVRFWLRAVGLLALLAFVRLGQRIFAYTAASLQAGFWMRALAPPAAADAVAAAAAAAGLACGHAMFGATLLHAAFCACGKGSTRSSVMVRSPGLDGGCLRCAVWHVAPRGPCLARGLGRAGP